MLRSVVKASSVGAIVIVTANYLTALFSSYILNLGYFMPCLASLPEQVGGEINAVLLQLLVCIFLGAGIGAVWVICCQKQWKFPQKMLWSAASIFMSLLLIAVVIVSMLR